LLLAYTLPLLFLAVFYLYPLVRILQLSLGETGSVDALVTILRQPFLWRVVWFTTWQAAASTLLTLAVGLPLAYLFAHYHFLGKKVLQALLTIPFVLPTVVVAAAFTSLLGERGVINTWLQGLLHTETPPLALLQSVWIILLAHVFYNVGVVVRTVGGFWANFNPRLAEAAQVLGADPMRLFREVTWPLLLPSILAASLLVFLFCFTSFGVVLILGGLRFATIEVEIYRQAVNLFNLPAAAVLSLLQMALTFVIMWFYTRLQTRASRPLELSAAQPHRLRAPSWPTRLLIGLGLTVTLGLLLAPSLALVWRSFTLGEGGWTTRYYAELAVNRRQSAFFAPPLIAVRNSLLFGLATMVISLLLGVLSAYLLARPRRWWTALLDPLFLLPLGTSAVTLGFGYLVAMGALRTSPWLTPIAHTLIAMPFVVRTFLPALRRLDPRLREAAAVLGAPPARVWWEVDLPLLYNALLVSAVFAFAISLGEFGATLLVSRPDLPTMPMVIYRALGQPGLLNYGQALAMSTILMTVTLLATVIIERFRPPGMTEF
jgi:thiamine transport system permease protein